jgi:hypothetical protein
MVDFSVIAACRGRHDLLRKFVHSVFATAARPESVELFIMTDDDDAETGRVVEDIVSANPGWTIVLRSRPRSPYLNRDYINAAAASARGKYLWVLGNDVEIATPGWDRTLKEGVERFLWDKPDRLAYVFIDDELHKHSESGGCCFPLVTRESVAALGFFMPPEYTTWGADHWLWVIYSGLKKNRIVDIRSVTARHYSHHTGRLPQDDVNKDVERNAHNPRVPPERLAEYISTLGGLIDADGAEARPDAVKVAADVAQPEEDARGMISIIFCSRVRDNQDSNVRRLLDSAVVHVHPEERHKLEFLIKYDDDDDLRPPDSFFAAYPFKIRTFAWSRGEGRHSLHNVQEFLFTQRDPRSRFCLMMADDFYFTRSGWISEILSIEDEFCIIGHNRPPIETFAGIYENEEAIRRWVTAFGALAPVVSVRLVEVCQNFGWQSNVDSWLMGLSVMLFDLYKILIWRHIDPYYGRGGGYGLGDTPTYNNMELTSQKGPFNKYWFELVRRQARNIFLNMEYGTDFKKTGSWPRRAWRKIRAQPLRRLPYRVCRKILSGVRLFWA